MEASNIVLSAPLKQLLDEHVLLRAEMDSFYEIAEDIEYESGPNVVQLFGELYERMLAFTEKLRAHSKREDEGLFPLMVRHLGENDRTIASMENEHKKAEQHLETFLTEARQNEMDLNEYDAQTITVYAVQAYATLTQHFAKEEKVLFPLAEKILKVEEKKELEQLFRG